MSDPAHKEPLGKDQWHLLPWRAARSAVRAFMAGNRSYEPGSWRRTPGWRDAYFDAAVRHLVAWYEGESIDPQSGEHHLGHAIACLAILFEREHAPPAPPPTSIP